MFLLTGYEYFLGFLLIAAAVPVLALVTNLIVAPKGRTGERKLTYEYGMAVSYTHLTLPTILLV